MAAHQALPSLGFSRQDQGIKFRLKFYQISSPSLVAQLVKNPPAVQETWVQSLGCEEPLENEMAAHSSVLVWRIPWTEEPGGGYELVLTYNPFPS